MKPLRLAVAGFGRLGRACADAVLLADDLTLAVITRQPEKRGQPLPKHLRQVPVVTDVGILREIDGVLLCLPEAPTREAAHDLLQHAIPIVECAALHGTAFLDHKDAIHRVALRRRTAAVVGAGWDPGALSLFRGLFALLTPKGHTETRELFPAAELELLFDVSHNTCKVEEHAIDGGRRRLHVHRKGATRAFGPGHPDLAPALRPHGQPVLIGGSMGTGSWVLAGTVESERRAFSSAVHGAGRCLSRHQALKQWRARDVIDELAARGVLIRSHSWRGVAEEAPGAYKDVDAVVDVAHRAGLAHKVARLRPLICIKG